MVYFTFIAGLMYSFVRFYEEPNLLERFDEGYDAYRRAVPGWRPRLRPWTPSSSTTVGAEPHG